MTAASVRSKLDRVMPYILIVCGIIGLIAAFIITDEKIKLLENPNYHPACSINPIISCGSVMESKQSHAFGFPNSLVGLAAFPVLIVTGVVLLGGARLKRWYWLGLNAGAFLAVLFCHWLFYQSVYSIHALCPYCMAVWTVTITTFWYVTLYNLQHGHIALHGRMQALAFWGRRHHLDILVLWFLIIAALILKHFWYYYGHYLVH